MVQAIRDQWAIIVAVIVLVSLVAWLWRGRARNAR
jgi:cbb3-type cytochrome oxidase subunit 3